MMEQLYRGFRGEILAIPGRVIAFAFGLILLLLPLITTDLYILGVLIFTAIYALYAASWDFLAGFTGQLNLGHALFFGVAAYVAALLNIHFDLSPWATIPIGALAAVIAGLIVGIPALRLRGFYLALVTLAFPIILIGIIYAFPDLTGGEMGLSGIESLAGSRVVAYYIVVLVMAGCLFLMWKLTDTKSKFIRTGLILRAIREDEITARASGINTTAYKFLAFAISGFFAGIAGGLYVHYIRVAGPSTLGLGFSFQPILWTVFGGMGTIYGPVVGTYILYPLLDLLRLHPIGAEVRLIVQALILIVFLSFMPEGIAVWIRDKMEIVCQRCKVVNAAPRHFCRACRAPLHVTESQGGE